MDKKLYMAIFKMTGHPDQTLGVTANQSDAWKIIQDTISQNQGVFANSFIVEEYFYKKELKMLDYQE